MEESKYIWLDGKVVPWNEAKIHVLTHALHYGIAPFEGIRCYSTSRGSAIFRFHEHMKRLYDSAKIVNVDIPYSREELEAATIDLIRRNEHEECYIRPIVFRGYGRMGVNPRDAPVQVAITTWPWGAYLGEEGAEKGVRVIVSSYTRYAVNTSMTKAKISGGYATGQLATMEAARGGYDEAIMLDPQGFLAEGVGENLFLVINGSVLTPPPTSILEGITRDSVMTLAKEEGLHVQEILLSRDQLYRADEVFFTGTAAEITPIREVDGRAVGNGAVGPVTNRLRERLSRSFIGDDETHADWLTYVNST